MLPKNILAFMSLCDPNKVLFSSKDIFIFDFDGTIVDSSEIHNQAFEEALSGFNLSFDYEDLKGLSTLNALKRIFNENQANIDESMLKSLQKKKQDISQKLYKDHIKLVDGFGKFISKLENKNCAIASSASKKSIMIALEKFNLLERFDPIISIEEVEFSKPAPDIFNKVLEYYAIEPNLAIVFEDSQAGFDAADLANLDCININTFKWIDLVQFI